jgi:lysophospholipase L1-like esterase
MNKNNHMARICTWSAALAALVFGGAELTAQPTSGNPQPLEWTTAQDHADMQRQLGITALRPGPSGRADAPNPANYDESVANPYPDWPELLLLDTGQRITTAAEWWIARRPEIVAAFEREVVGRVPADVPGVRWSVTDSADATLAGKRVVGRKLVGRADNSAYPAIEVGIDFTLVLPADADGRVPVMILFGSRTLGQALGTEPLRGFGGGPPPPSSDPPATEQLIAAGWGFAFLDPTSVQADNGAGLTRGIIGLANKGQARKPDDWGALRAWAWGAQRALDYLATERAVDASRVGVEGVSRYGKAALVAMAFDQRFAVVLIGSSGEGGVSPYRRNFGEMVENLTGQGEYHWMAGNFLKYGTAESSFGSLNAGNLPIDSHTLLALCAPRPTFVSYGVPERGDALWLDQLGSYRAAVAAGEVFRLLGAQDLGRRESYKTAELPAVNESLLDGALAWRQHDGGHTDAPNWRHFIPWAERELGLDADAPATTVPRRRTDSNSEIAHAELVQKAGAGVIDVYFVGDSITRRWGALDYPELLAHFRQSFSGWNAANFGWGGDRTQNMLWRLDNGELDRVSPKVFVVQAGTNNLADFDAAELRVDAIAAGVEAIVSRLRRHSPDALVVVTGVFPRRDRPELNPSIAAINARLAAYADEHELRYLDIGDRLVDSRGVLKDEMSQDGLHLSLAGYRVWADALTPVLEQRLGPRAERDLAPAPTGNPAARPAVPGGGR